MDIRDLIYFKAVYDKKTLAAASEQLNISQPGLTYAIRRLEKELGVELFERGKNSIKINDAGKTLAKYAITIIDEQNMCLKEMQDYANKNNVIRLASCDPGPRWYLGDVFSIKYPQMDLDSFPYDDSSTAIRMLNENKVDLIISDAPITQKGIICKFLARDNIYLSVHQDDKRFKGETSISLHDPRINELIFYSIKGSFSHKLEKFYDSISDNTFVRIVKEYVAFESLLKAKKALTVNTRIVRNYRDDGDKRYFIPIIDEETSINYYISYRAEDEAHLRYILTIAAESARKFN